MELKGQYPYIQRIAYLCKHETACLLGADMEEKRRIKNLQDEMHRVNKG